MKQFYQIHELARLFDLCPDTLRYYEEKGLLHPVRGENRYRMYGIQDVCTLNIIRSLRELGIPTRSIRAYLERRSVGETLELLDREEALLRRRMAELESALAEAENRRARLERYRNAEAGRVELVEELLKIPGMMSISLNVNRERSNVILGKEIINLYGPGYITDFIGQVKYRISPLSFYQVNPVQTVKLYGKALEYAGLTGQETVWDLYCGIGTISLFLAQKAKQVYGVEIVPEAIRDARENARMNGIENAQFFVGKAEEVLPREYEANRIYADVIVVDPPRKGCDSVCLDTIVKMGPKRVVYVSCDSATLARDVKYLGERGYEVRRVGCCDMFGGSGHCESVVKLERKN